MNGFCGDDARGEDSFLEGFPSGQWEQAVNLPAFAFVGSNPTPSTSQHGQPGSRATAFTPDAPERIRRMTSRMPSTSTTQSARERSASREAGRAAEAGVLAGSVPAGRRVFAGVAQLVERQPSKLNVASSSLVSRSVIFGRGRPNPRPVRLAASSGAAASFCVAEPIEAVASPLLSARSTQADAVGAFCSGFVGGGSSGSLVSRCFAHLAQLVEHVLGKDEVTSSILVVGSKRLRHVAPLLGGRALSRVFAVATLGCGNGRGSEESRLRG